MDYIELNIPVSDAEQAEILTAEIPMTEVMMRMWNGPRILCKRRNNL